MSQRISRQNFLGRFPAPAIPDGHISISSNLANRFNAPNNISQNSGNNLHYDVSPNGRLQQVALIEDLLAVYSSFGKVEHEYASAPGLMLYMNLLIHAHAYHTDALFRHQPSYAASTIINDAILSEFYDNLLELPVPPIVQDILLGLSRYESPAHPGLTFMHTYAATTFNTDFPFLIPCHIFALAHNVMINAATNAAPATLANEWLRSILVDTGNNATQYRVGQFLGQLFDLPTGNAGAPQTYVHYDYFNTRMINIFSPVTQRYHKTRPFFANMNITPPPLSNLTNGFNSYIYSIGVTRNNVRQYSQVLTKLAVFVKANFKTTHTLGQVLATNVGSNILNYFNTEPLLPGHHHKTLAAASDANRNSVETALAATHANMATATDFCQPEVQTAAANTHEFPRTPNVRTHVPNAATGTATTTFTEALYLVSNVTLAETTTATDPTSYSNAPYNRVLYDDSRHYMPDVLFFSPLSAPASAAFSSTISGLLVQSSEIDSVSVHMHDPRAHLALENTHFLTGVVPIGSLPNYANAEAINYRERTRQTTDAVRSGLMLFDKAVNTLGRFATRVPNAITAITGFSTLDGIRFPWEMFSYFTYSSALGTNNQTNGRKRIYAWSPYRHVRNEFSTTSRWNNTFPGAAQNPIASDDIVVLFTLEGIFGTNGTTYGMEFPTRRLD